MVARDEDAAVGWGGVEVEVAVKGVARGRMSLRCKYPRVLCLANTKKIFCALTTKSYSDHAPRRVFKSLNLYLMNTAPLLLYMIPFFYDLKLLLRSDSNPTSSLSVHLVKLL